MGHGGGLSDLPAVGIRALSEVCAISQPKPDHRPAVRRYEKTMPGELVQVDVKKLGNILGGGWRVHGHVIG